MKNKQKYKDKFHVKNLKEIIESPDFIRKSQLESNIYGKVMRFLITQSRLSYIKRLLPNNMRRHVLFIDQSSKNPYEILLAFDNLPVCKEFNQYISKEVLRILQREDIQAKYNLGYFNSIKGWLPRERLFTHKPKQIYLSNLREQAEGDFENLALDEELHEIFEEIRKIIKNNKSYIEKLYRIDGLPQESYIYNLGDITHYRKKS